MLCDVIAAMQSELAHETLDRQNQAMTENLAMKVSRLRDVCCQIVIVLSLYTFHCVVASLNVCQYCQCSIVNSKSFEEEENFCLDREPLCEAYPVGSALS